jgi:hypothetical protein
MAGAIAILSLMSPRVSALGVRPLRRWNGDIPLQRLRLMGRHPKSTARSWETAGGKVPFARLYRDLLQSAAFTDLTATQRCLYTVCASKIYGTQSPDGHMDHFTLTKLDWCNSYGLYSKNGENSFRRDMTALIEHGFVDCIEDRHHVRAPIIYGMSVRWRCYGTSAFDVPQTVMTISMRRSRSTRNTVP